MSLPEEAIDGILSHLPLNDERSLASKSSLEPSRRLPFANVSIHVGTNQSWLNNISPTNTKLLPHVRSSTCFLQRQNAPYNPRYGTCAIRDNFPSFCQLEPSHPSWKFRSRGARSSPSLGVSPTFRTLKFAGYRFTRVADPFFKLLVPCTRCYFSSHF